MLSDGAASTIETDPEQARTAMLTVRDTGRTALADMRRLLGVLRDDEPGSYAPQPGIAQLPRLLEESCAAGVPVQFIETGGSQAVPQSIDLTVYRIVQEALTNVRKHAGLGVSEVRVTLAHTPESITVTVTDDGAGSAAGAGRHIGHGLIGMRERVAAHHGQLRAGQRPKAVSRSSPRSRQEMSHEYPRAAGQRPGDDPHGAGHRRGHRSPGRGL